MTDMLMIAVTALACVMVVAGTVLAGFRGWLALKTREIDLRRPAAIDGGSPEGAARIELADLKERIRKLEAIANGVDL